MSRATSLNWELQVDGQIIHLLEIGEFGEGEEGRIEVADGDRKYKIRDQIFNIDEIEITVLITRLREYYNILQNWCLSGETKDVFLVGRDSAHIPRMTFLLSETDLAMGKKNAFNRVSKEADKKKYWMIPYYVEEIF
jgi:hypothetical protein